MSEETSEVKSENAAAGAAALASNAASGAAPRARSPYIVFFWGGLALAVVCAFVGYTRLGMARPARADGYFITGLFGLLSSAMAWSLGRAHERALRSTSLLKDAVDRLQDRMADMPRSLMEESVKVAEREAAGRRADQERQARELREALESGINKGFAPLAPALSERIEASLSGLSDSLRSDREERAARLREMAETVTSLQAAQKEWAQGSSALLEKLREQGTLLHKDIAERDVSGRATLADLSASAAKSLTEISENAAKSLSEASAAAAERFQAASDIQLEKVRDLAEGIQQAWDQAATRMGAEVTASAQGVSDASAAALRTAVAEAKAQWAEINAAAAQEREAIAAERKATLDFAREYFEKSSDALLQGLTASADAVKTVSAQAEERVRASAEQAEQRLGANAEQAATWLESLAGAAGKIEEALAGLRRGGEESAAQQAEWRATVDMFHQGIGGVLDRLQSLASYSQGQEALLHKMEAAIRAFEERSAELLEETALKAQESLLEALDQAGVRSEGAEAPQA